MKTWTARVVALTIAASAAWYVADANARHAAARTDLSAECEEAARLDRLLAIAQENQRERLAVRHGAE